uniref:PiggyBac transposable element-derived protein 3-like n=1 Tax=Diabrotica virgifera virgifera TaxID=50390 RepID=A0A6P7GPF1_DIAVI
MGNDGVFALIEEIPSDGESEASDIDSDVEDLGNSEPDNGIPGTQHSLEEMNQMVDEGEHEKENNESVFSDSDDCTPLSVFGKRKRKLTKQKQTARKKNNNVHVKKNEIVKWSENIQTYYKTPSSFVEEVGPDIPDLLEDPLELFMLLFSEELLDILVFQTNLYATQMNQGNANKFTPTNREEMKCFLGINILMGIKHLPSYKDYWSSRTDLRDGFIASYMSRNRFIHIAVDDKFSLKRSVVASNGRETLSFVTKNIPGPSYCIENVDN